METTIDAPIARRPPVMLRILMSILICVPSACTPLAEAYLIGSSEAMQTELRNGAIVRAEMRARGEVPWSNWPW